MSGRSVHDIVCTPQGFSTQPSISTLSYQWKKGSSRLKKGGKTNKENQTDDLESTRIVQSRWKREREEWTESSPQSIKTEPHAYHRSRLQCTQECMNTPSHLQEAYAHLLIQIQTQTHRHRQWAARQGHLCSSGHANHMDSSCIHWCLENSNNKTKISTRKHIFIRSALFHHSFEEASNKTGRDWETDNHTNTDVIYLLKSVLAQGRMTILFQTDHTKSFKEKPFDPIWTTKKKTLSEGEKEKRMKREGGV